MEPHNHLPLVASVLYCRPWNVLPEVHSELGSLYKRYLTGDLRDREIRERPAYALDLPSARSESNRLGSGVAWAYDDEAGLAVLWLDGIVGKKVPEMLSGPAVMDLVKVDQVLKELLTMPQIATVVLNFDSPGGCGLGLQETCELIAELRESRRVVGYSDGQCCSAAYWLAAACDEFYGAPSSQIGSIGTYIAGLDSSRWFEMEGLELKLFRHGNLKAIGATGKPWTPEEEKYLADMVETHGEEFRSWIRERRDGIEDSSMEGQWFIAKDAPAGLVDGLFRDFEELLGAVLEGE